MRTIGIKLADGSFYPILEEGKPTQKTLEITPANDNQTAVLVDLYRSDSGTMDDAEYVDTLRIDVAAYKPESGKSLSFTVSLDENNHLSAKIHDPDLGATADTEIALKERTETDREQTKDDADNVTMASGADDFTLPQDEAMAVAMAASGAAVESAAALDDAIAGESDAEPLGLDDDEQLELGGDDSTAFDEPVVPDEDAAFDEPIDEPISMDDEPAALDESDAFDEPVVPDETLDDFDLDMQSIESENADEAPIVEEPEVEDAPAEPVEADEASMDNEPIDEAVPISDDDAAVPEADLSVSDYETGNDSDNEKAIDFADMVASVSSEPTHAEVGYMPDAVHDADEYEDDADEVPVTEEPPAIEEPPIVEEPKVEDAPAPIEEPPVAEMPPVVEEESTPIEEAPVAEELPDAGEPIAELPVEEESAPVEEPPVEELPVEEPPIEEPTVVEAEPSAVEEELPVDDLDLSDFEVDNDVHDAVADTILGGAPTPAAEEELPPPVVEEPTVIEEENTPVEEEQPPMEEPPALIDSAETSPTIDEAISDLPDFSDLDFSIPDIPQPPHGDFDLEDDTEESDAPSKPNADSDVSEMGSLSLDDLLDDDMDLGAGTDSADDDDMDEGDSKEEKKKHSTVVPVIICVACAIICLLATGALALYLFGGRHMGLPWGQGTAAESPVGDEDALAQSALPESETVEGNSTAISVGDNNAAVTPPKGANTSAPVAEDKTAPATPANNGTASESPVSEPPMPGSPSSEAPAASETAIVVATLPQSTLPTNPQPKRPDIKHTVHWGDTLWDISQSYYKTPWRYKYIARYNNIKDPDYIVSGTTILIPAQ